LSAGLAFYDPATKEIGEKAKEPPHQTSHSPNPKNSKFEFNWPFFTGNFFRKR
jgi:hypothetical protein